MTNLKNKMTSPWFIETANLGVLVAICIVLSFRATAQSTPMPQAPSSVQTPSILTPGASELQKMPSVVYYPMSTRPPPQQFGIPVPVNSYPEYVGLPPRGLPPRGWNPSAPNVPVWPSAPPYQPRLNPNGIQLQVKNLLEEQTKAILNLSSEVEKLSARVKQLEANTGKPNE